MMDPVVTSGAGMLRFEVLSSCCGPYARLDLAESAIDCGFMAHGSTNVDLNPRFLGMLGRLRKSDRAMLSVGREELVLESGTERVSERKVELPERWVRGLGEAAAIQSRMEPVTRLQRVPAMRFISELRPGRPRNDDVWLVPAGGGGLRTSRTAQATGIRVRGLARLAVLKPLAQQLRGLTLYRDAEFQEASAWQIDFDTQRLTVIVSPDIYRGFSGEGQLLMALAGGVPDTALTAIDDALCWQRALVPKDFAECGQADAAFLALGARGLLGYDSCEQGFFHRDLPFDASELRSPRLVNARTLCENGAVAWIEAGRVAEVSSGPHRYRVVFDGERPTCNCQWSLRHQGSRGACKHILACRLTEDE
jgi:hypothetical protein